VQSSSLSIGATRPSHTGTAVPRTQSDTFAREALAGSLLPLALSLMSNWKLTLSYDGTHFHGWQIQPGLPTVQGTLRHALAQLTGENTLPHGSGRTDTGVHALGQVVTVALDADIPSDNLFRSLNRILPRSIRVLSAEIVPDAFHARFSARRKTYEYRIFEQRLLHSDGNPLPQRFCSPFVAPYAWEYRWPLAFDLMQQAAESLIGTYDFTSFAASDPDLSQRTNTAAPLPNPIRTIYSSTWLREDGLLVYRVNGSGFLHHMVRNIVGTLTDIGRGAIPPNTLPAILAARDRTAAGPTAPPQGLYLVSVDYEKNSESAEQ
jgi:tRNA pseudouridine38-40 synthase